MNLEKIVLDKSNPHKKIWKNSIGIWQAGKEATASGEEGYGKQGGRVRQAGCMVLHFKRITSGGAKSYD